MFLTASTSKRLGLRHGRFGGAIHRHHQLVGLAFHADEAHAALDLAQRVRQRNLHFRIVEKSVLAPEQFDRFARALREARPSSRWMAS